MTIPVIFSTGSLHPFGLERVYSWASEAGYDGVEVMMDDRWDTHQSAYLGHLVEKYGLPIRAFHPPLYGGAWNLGPQETLVRVAKLARTMEVTVVVAHPPPPGRSLERWSAGPLREARERGVCVAVENMPRGEVRGIFGLGRFRNCHLPEHLLGLGDVTLDTSHVGASKVGLMQAYSVLARQIRPDWRRSAPPPWKRPPPLEAVPRRPRMERLPRRRKPGAQALDLGRTGARDYPEADARGAGVCQEGADPSVTDDPRW
jgi:hypothetical protein